MQKRSMLCLSSVVLLLAALFAVSCGGAPTSTLGDLERDAAGKGNLKNGKIDGKITAIDEDSLTVGETEFLITEDTTWRRPNNKEADPSEFPVGTRVIIRAEEDEDGNWSAIEVKAVGQGIGLGLNKPPAPVIKSFEGMIEEISDTELTLHGDLVFIVNDDTEFLDADGEELEDTAIIDAGDLVSVQAQKTGTTWTALSIRLISDNPVVDNFIGTIDSIDETTLSVGGQEFTVDDLTHFMNEDGSDLDSSNFDEGDLVNVEAREEADGSWTALHVALIDDNDTDPVLQLFNGAIMSLSDTEFTVGTDLFLLDDASEWFLLDGTLGSIDDFEISDEVQVLASQDGTDWTAISITMTEEGGLPSP